MTKVELTPAKLAEIKQKAEAAEKESPSPWHGVPDGSHCVLVDSEQGVIHTTCDRQRNTADFIAHADPATVLAMVEEIEFLRRNSMIKTELLGKFMFKTKESEAGQ